MWLLCPAVKPATLRVKEKCCIDKTKKSFSADVNHNLHLRKIHCWSRLAKPHAIRYTGKMLLLRPLSFITRSQNTGCQTYAWCMRKKQNNPECLIGSARGTSFVVWSGTGATRSGTRCELTEWTRHLCCRNTLCVKDNAQKKWLPSLKLKRPIPCYGRVRKPTQYGESTPQIIETALPLPDIWIASPNDKRQLYLFLIFQRNMHVVFQQLHRYELNYHNQILYTGGTVWSTYYNV